MKLLKKYIFSFLICLPTLSFSQTRFGNEWINFGQEYLKITVNQNGIYRINKADLVAQSFSTTGKILRKYKLYHRGKEIAIKIVGNPETEIQASDFIYFYGKANDGGQDDELYKYGATRTNPYFSLYSDNTAYFLTADNGNDGKRMSNAPTANPSIASDAFYISKIIDNQINQYNHDISKSGIPGVIQSYFEPFEGMCSWPYFGRNVASSGTVSTRALNRSYPLPNFLSGTGTDISFETKATSRRTEAKNITYTLENGAPTGSVTGTFTLGSNFFTGYKLNTSIANVTGNLDVYMNTVSPFDKDLWSFFYMLIKYPTSPIYVDKKEYELIGSSNLVQRLNLSTPISNVFGFEISDFENQSEINLVNNTSSLDIYISNANPNLPRKLYLSSTISTPASLKKIVFTQIDPNLYDYIILTDKRLTTGATAYKNYKELPEGGNFDVHLAFIDEVFDQFSYGERTPYAIKRYADWMTNTSKKMKYMFIIGKSISITNKLKLYFSSETQTFSSPNLLPYPHADNPDDFVPTIGYPASDIALTSGLLGTIETVPAIPTGRLVVSTNEEIIGTPITNGGITTYGGYLGKVIEHSNRPNSDYQKKLLHIAGPQHGEEINSLKKALEDCRDFAKLTPFSASPTDYVTYNKDPLNVHTAIACSQAIGDYKNLNVPPSFYDKVNAGVGIMTYYGHGSSDEVAFYFGYVSKSTNNSCSGEAAGGDKYLEMVDRDMNGTPILTNGKTTTIPKYSLFIGSGCGISNSFFGNKDLASDWVNTPKKGSINAISNTSLSYETYDTRALLKLYETMFGNAPNAKLKANGKIKGTNAMLDNAIGDIFKQASLNNIAANTGGDPNGPNPDKFFISNLDQTILLGDPSIAIFRPPGITQPLSLTLLDVKALNEDKKNVITWKTENEIDFNGFDVERSIDSKKFEKIGFVKGKGTENEQYSYNFDDFNPIEGLNYYRLKMIDENGKSSYSKVVSTKFEDLNNSLLIFSNPIIGGKFSFKLNNYLENSAILTDIKGNKIAIEVISKGNNIYQTNILKNNLKGVLILKLKNKNNESFAKKIISE